MSESKWTPGPWEMESYDGYDKEIWIRGNGYLVASSLTDDIDFKEGEANACLIAAAPDLLEACEAFASFEAHADRCADCDEWGPGNCQEGREILTEACDLRDVAIAKAKGEPQ